MTSYTPRHEDITGADLSGVSGTANRTYTLTNSNSVLAQMQLILAENVLMNVVNFTFVASTGIITFLGKVWDNQNISIDYNTTEAVAVVGTDYYTDTKTIAREAGLGLDIWTENLGTGDNSTNSFSMVNTQIMDGSYKIFYGATGSNDFTTLTEDTHYDIDIDQGKILLTTAGVTALGTNLLYANYTYTTQISDTEMALLLPRIDEEVDRMTGRGWGTPSTITDYFDGGRSFTYPTTDEPFARDYDEPDEVQLKGNVTEVNYVYFLRKNAIFNAIYSSDGGTYTDNTDEGNSLEGTAFPVFATSAAANDEIYFGVSDRFFGMTIRLATLGVDSGSLDVDWYYYNGTSWVTFTPTAQTSGADDFTASGRLTWDYLDAWEKTTVNSSDSYYYIKAVLTTDGYTTDPTIRYCSLDNDTVVNQEIPLSSVDWDSSGRLTFVDKRIPNGNRIVKVVYKSGETTTNPLIPELASLIGGLMVFTKITGKSIDTPSTYTMPEGSVSVGQLYVNVAEVAKQMRKRIGEIMAQLGQRLDILAI